MNKFYKRAPFLKTTSIMNAYTVLQLSHTSKLHLSQNPNC